MIGSAVTMIVERAWFWENGMLRAIVSMTKMTLFWLPTMVLVPLLVPKLNPFQWISWSSLHRPTSSWGVVAGISIFVLDEIVNVAVRHRRLTREQFAATVLASYPICLVPAVLSPWLTFWIGKALGFRDGCRAVRGGRRPGRPLVLRRHALAGERLRPAQFRGRQVRPAVLVAEWRASAMTSRSQDADKVPWWMSVLVFTAGLSGMVAFWHLQDNKTFGALAGLGAGSLAGGFGLIGFCSLVGQTWIWVRAGVAGSVAICVGGAVLGGVGGLVAGLLDGPSKQTALDVTTAVVVGLSLLVVLGAWLMEKYG